LKIFGGKLNFTRYKYSPWIQMTKRAIIVYTIQQYLLTYNNDNQ